MSRIFALAVAVSGYVLLGAPTMADPNCTCRNAGQSYQVGQIVCIRGKLARCEMFLNNTSWKMLADNCPESLAPSETRVAGLPRPIERDRLQ